MTETCEASSRVFVRRSISFAACSCSLRWRSCTDLFMYILNEYQATPSGRRKTSTPTGPRDWYASASAAPFTAVASQLMGIQPKFWRQTGPNFWSEVSAMTVAVNAVFTRKYSAAETDTATIVGTNAPGGTLPPTKL